MHSSENRFLLFTHSSRSMCFPSGFRVVTSIVPGKGRATKTNAKNAFYQTVNMERDVHVIRRMETANRKICLWPLPATVCGLVNANGKWQVPSDEHSMQLDSSSLPLQRSCCTWYHHKVVVLLFQPNLLTTSWYVERCIWSMMLSILHIHHLLS